MGDGVKYNSAERSWTKVVGRTPRPILSPIPVILMLSPGPDGAWSGMDTRMPEPQSLANRLLTDAKLLNHGLVAFGIGFSEVIQQATTLADHHEKTAPGGMVLLMGLEMLRQFTNPLAEDGNLHLGRTGIGRVRAVLVN